MSSTPCTPVELADAILTAYPEIEAVIVAEKRIFHRKLIPMSSLTATIRYKNDEGVQMRSFVAEAPSDLLSAVDSEFCPF